MSTAIPLLSLHALMPSTGTTLPLNPHDLHASTHTQSWEEWEYNLYGQAQDGSDDKHLTPILYIHEVLSSNTSLMTGYPD